MDFLALKGNRSKRNNSGTFWLEYKTLDRDVMSDLDTCKFEKVVIKNEALCLGQGHLWAF